MSAAAEVHELRIARVVIHLDDAVTGELRSAIDAEDAHGASLSRKAEDVRFFFACLLRWMVPGYFEIPSSGELAVA